MSAIERLRAVRAGTQNVGGAERLLRGAVGSALIVLGATAIAGLVTLASGTAGLALAVVAILAGARMTRTAITRRCYVNALLGRDSSRAPDGADNPSRDAETADHG